MDQGSRSQMVFFVMSGRVEIEERLGEDDTYGGTKTAAFGNHKSNVRTVTQGSVFGEEVIIGFSDTQVGTAKTFGKCLIWRIPGQKLMDTLKEVTSDSRSFVRTIADGMHGEVRDIVAQIGSLHKNDSDLVDRIAGSFQTSVFLKGQTIYAQETAGDTLTMITHGHVRIEANDTTIGELVADGKSVQVLGERHLLGIAPVRCCALRAKMLTVVRTLKQQDCKEVLGDYFEELKQQKLTQLGDTLAEAHALNSAPSRFLALLGLDYERRVVVPGAFVCQEGEPADCMFFLARGTAVVERRGGVPQEITEGVCFDELAALGCVNTRDATVVAATVATVQVLHRHTVLQALEDYPEQAERFWCSLRWNKKQGMEKKALHALGQNNFLQNVQDQQFMTRLAGRCELRFYFPEQRIIRQDDKEDRSMFFVQHGTASLEIDGVAKRKLYAGDSFGEYSAMSMTVMRAATIRAKSVCACWVLSSEILTETLNEFPVELARFENLAMNNILSDKVAFQRVLSEFNFFSNCSSDFLERMATSVEGRRFEAHYNIVTQGEQGESVFFLHRGRAVVLVGGVQVGELNDRSCFGEMAVLGVSKDRTATIRTTTSSIVWELSRDILLESLKKFPLEERRFKELAQMRSKVNKQLLDDDQVKPLPARRNTIQQRRQTRLQSMAHLQANMLGTLQGMGKDITRQKQRGTSDSDSESDSDEDADTVPALDSPKRAVVQGDARRQSQIILTGMATGNWQRQLPRVKKRQSAICMGLLGWQETATGTERTFRAWRNFVRAERKERALQRKRDKEIALWLERKQEQRTLAKDCADYRFALPFSAVPREQLYDDQVKVLDLGPGLDGTSQSLVSMPSRWSSIASQSRCQHRVDSAVQVYRPQPQGLRAKHRRRLDVLTPQALQKLHATRPRLGRIAAALEREELWDDWQDG